MAFQLKPDRKETENKTIRFPLSLVERIKTIIENQDVSFPALYCRHVNMQSKIWSP